MVDEHETSRLETFAKGLAQELLQRAANGAEPARGRGNETRGLDRTVCKE
jgi:hypothetical protein